MKGKAYFCLSCAQYLLCVSFVAHRKLLSPRYCSVKASCVRFFEQQKRLFFSFCRCFTFIASDPGTHERGPHVARGMVARCTLPSMLAMLAACKLVAILVFASGFLLTRVELTDKSACGDFRVEDVVGEGDMLHGCWTDTPLDKVVVLIIDGARFDFASPVSQTDSDLEADEMNANVAKLHSIGEILQRDGPRTSELFRFVADPPTTTQQRLKGILTGGLPTFVDVSKSFGAAVLTEDNVIAQCAAQGKRVALSGDDTWLELFHSMHFAAGAEPFPSYNVKDLDTVDNGVRQHIMARLKKPDEWDLLIGHFLGVDHAGHTFGVDSAAMRRKVGENDADVRAVISAMSADAKFDKSLLVVMGDHGMTMHGDHGGGTEEETDSFLFAHHPRAAALRRASGEDETGTSQSATQKKVPDDAFERMPQIDFAPTMSLLLGVPIPFGNLGTVPRRFWEIAHAREVLRDGAGKGWLDSRYKQATQVTSEQVWRYLTRYVGEAGNPFAAVDWLDLDDLYETAVSDARDGTTEDLSADFEKAKRFSRFLFRAAELARAQWVQFSLGKMILGLVFLTVTIGVQGFVLYKHCAVDGQKNGMNPLKALAVVASMGIAFAARLSNSFIVAEGDVMHFLFATFAITRTVEALSRAHTDNQAWKVKAKSAVGLLACNAALQALGATWVKEESLSDDDESASVSRSAGFPTPVLLGALAVSPWMCSQALVPIEGARGVRAAVAAALGAIGARALSSGTGVKAFARVFGWRWIEVFAAEAHFKLPWVVYFATFLAVTVFTPQISKSKSQSKRSQIVRAAHAHAWSVLPVLVMLFGERGALWGVLALTQASCLAGSVCCEEGSDSSEMGTIQSNPQDDITLAWGWYLMTTSLFFAGGHRCAFDGLHFACAFTGFTQFNFFIMGTLLAMNTWSGNIVACALLPAAASQMVQVGEKEKKKASATDAKKQVSIQPSGFQLATRRVALAYSLFTSVGVLVSTAFVALERRHLMVWAIFAPKFIFEACGMVVGEALLVAGVAARVNY